MTQQAIAEEVGVDQATVSRTLCTEPEIPQNVHKPKRVQLKVSISRGTNPDAAAQRIRDKLGDEFADALGNALG